MRPRIPWAPLCRRLGAAPMAGAGALHLQLWATGYSQVTVIGPLFLLDAVTSALLALGLVVTGSRVLAALGALIELAAIAGLALASTTGLFGFHQLGSGVEGDIAAAYAAEGLAALLLLAGALPGRPAHRPRQGSREAPTSPRS